MNNFNVGSLRLDAAIEKVRSVDLGPLDTAHLAHFGPIQAGPDVSLGEVFRKPNLVDAMFDFIMPEISDPTILRFNRSNALLNGVAREVAAAGATTEASAEAAGAGTEGDLAMDRLGAMVLKSELERFQALRQRLGSLIEA